MIVLHREFAPLSHHGFELVSPERKAASFNVLGYTAGLKRLPVAHGPEPGSRGEAVRYLVRERSALEGEKTHLLVITKRGKWRVFEDVRAALSSERHRANRGGGVWASEEPGTVRRA